MDIKYKVGTRIFNTEEEAIEYEKSIVDVKSFVLVYYNREPNGEGFFNLDIFPVIDCDESVRFSSYLNVGNLERLIDATMGKEIPRYLPLSNNHIGKLITSYEVKITGAKNGFPVEPKVWKYTKTKKHDPINLSNLSYYQDASMKIVRVILEPVLSSLVK